MGWGPCRMTRKFRRLRNVCASFPRFLQQVQQYDLILIDSQNSTRKLLDLKFDFSKEKDINKEHYIQ